MNAQDRAYLESLPEYQLYLKLVQMEEKLIELIKGDIPETAEQQINLTFNKVAHGRRHYP